jgi:20S proteasome subunit alpha 4
VIGGNSKQVSEFLEKNYKEDLASLDAVKLAVKALLDVVESGNKNIELVVMSKDSIKHLSDT